MSEPVVQVNQLTKSYGDYLAVDHISFEIKEGEILGVLGPNGAGKSTTIQMLLGLTEADGGEIKYFGKNFFENPEYCLKRMNFASAYSQLQGKMTVYQNLRIYAGLYEVKGWKERITELLQLFEIEQLKDVLFWKLSSGQQTRAILAKALLNRPKLILMDEPTASLDPEIVNKIIDVIKNLQKQENISVLFTSHNMEEVARLCDRVMFISRGKIVANDTPLELTKKVGFTKLIVAYEGQRSVVRQYLEKNNFKHTFINSYLVEVEIAEPEIPKVLFGLKEQNVWVTNISIEKPSLEDVFLSISQAQKQ